MKFSAGWGESGGGLALRATASEYDAIPLIGEIKVNAVPWTRHPDRVAVALCLMFGDDSAGAFEVPDPGCSPHVAAAIEDFLAPSVCKVFPINLTPSRIVHGETQLNLYAGGSLDSSFSSTVGRRDGCEVINLRLSNEGVGAFMDGTEFIVSTNAILANADDSRPLYGLLPALGVAVLFCEDLYAGSISARLPVQGADRISEKVVSLLDSVGIKVVWC